MSCLASWFDEKKFSKGIECVQKRCLKLVPGPFIILSQCGLERLDVRRDMMTQSIFRQIKDPKHPFPLHYLLPPVKVSHSQMVLRPTYPWHIEFHWPKLHVVPYCISKKFFGIGRGSPRSAPSRQISPLWLWKCGLTAPKSPKMVIFGINFPQKGISLKRFFLQNFAWERLSLDCTCVPNFTAVALKMWLRAPKSSKMVFLVKICPWEKIRGVDRKTWI